MGFCDIGEVLSEMRNQFLELAQTVQCASYSTGEQAILGEETMTADSPYTGLMQKAWDKTSGKGHVLSEWKPLGERGYISVCSRCKGKLTILEDPKINLIGSDPFMGLDFCPADDPELMERIFSEWCDMVARVYTLILSWPAPGEGKSDV